MSNLQAFLAGERARELVNDNGLIVSAIRRWRKLRFDVSRPDVAGVIDEVSAVADSGFGTHVGDTRGHFLDVDALLLLHDGERIRGFASAHMPREGFLYLHGIVVSHEIQGRGGSRMLVDGLLSLTRLRHMAFTTQNPIMFCLLRSRYRKIYPSPKRARVPWRLRQRASRLMAKRDGTFDPVTGVAKGMYGGLYQKIPESRDPEVNTWFARTLELREGTSANGFLFIGEGRKRRK